MISTCNAFFQVELRTQTKSQSTTTITSNMSSQQKDMNKNSCPPLILPKLSIHCCLHCSLSLSLPFSLSLFLSLFLSLSLTLFFFFSSRLLSLAVTFYRRLSPQPSLHLFLSRAILLNLSPSHPIYISLPISFICLSAYLPSLSLSLSLTQYSFTQS